MFWLLVLLHSINYCSFFFKKKSSKPSSFAVIVPCFVCKWCCVVCVSERVPAARLRAKLETFWTSSLKNSIINSTQWPTRPASWGWSPETTSSTGQTHDNPHMKWLRKPLNAFKSFLRVFQDVLFSIMKVKEVKMTNKHH